MEETKEGRKEGWKETKEGNEGRKEGRKEEWRNGKKMSRLQNIEKDITFF